MTDETVLVEFSSVRDLSALHRMLMERKFEGPDDMFFGSPQIAAAQHAILDALIDALPHRAESWRSWRDARTHSLELERVRAHLGSHAELFAAMDQTRRRDYVAMLLAPLIPDPELLAELTEGNDKINTELEA